MRLAAVIAVLIAAIIPSTSAQLPAFGVGLLRPDGILVPVAVLDGREWIDPWPAPSDDMRLNRMIESVPSYWRQRKQSVPASWQLVTGGLPVQVNVLTHVVFGEHCGNQVGLLTDAPRSSWDFHRRRLALTRIMPVVHPVTVDPGDREWREIVAHVRLEVARQESEAITREEAQTGRASALEPVAERSELTFRRLADTVATTPARCISKPNADTRSGSGRSCARRPRSMRADGFSCATAPPRSCSRAVR